MKIQYPSRNAVQGDLVQTLLIQVQKTKVDIDLAMVPLDKLLKSNEPNFAFLAEKYWSNHPKIAYFIGHGHGVDVLGLGLAQLQISVSLGIGHGFGHKFLFMNLQRNGNDLKSKQIIKDKKTMNLITEALTGTTNDYFVGNCEWDDGTRSDLVL
ncbi:hypothetical protein INT47_004204 [Mucor saturninus]|uniref:Uncharacterized protein n=1 Tax=Mucor saturninus TaxID=64648 RepID=A0A8H7QKV6_9FUNG|nr:hypothetical protein INT47_004204 [Mucor saturninus]